MNMIYQQQTSVILKMHSKRKKERDWKEKQTLINESSGT